MRENLSKECEQANLKDCQLSAVHDSFDRLVAALFVSMSLYMHLLRFHLHKTTCQLKVVNRLWC